MKTNNLAKNASKPVKWNYCSVVDDYLAKTSSLHQVDPNDMFFFSLFPIFLLNTEKVKVLNCTGFMECFMYISKIFLLLQNQGPMKYKYQGE